MLYILKSNKSRNIAPEVQYGSGNMSFPIGLFLFDTNTTKESYRASSDWIEIDSERYYINKDLKFENPIRAEIIFLRLKIKELEMCSFNFFMPKSFQKYINKYKNLTNEYPEYTL